MAYGGVIGTNGPVLGDTSTNIYVNQTNVAFPNAAAGVRQNLNGTYLVRVHAVNPDRLTGSPLTAIQYSGQNYYPGETISSASNPSTTAELRLFNTTGTRPTWYRNNDGLGRCTDRNIDTGTITYTYPGSIAGTWSWSTVPTAPASVSVSVSGTSATITRGNSTSDSSYPVSSYIVQRRESATTTFSGSWTNTVTMSGTTHTYTGLNAAKYYQFRVYANNAIGSSQAVTSSTVFIAAVTRYDGSSFILLSKLKRWNGSAWTNITTAKRWDGTTWQTIDISSIPNT